MRAHIIERPGSVIRVTPGIGDVALMCVHAERWLPGGQQPASHWFSLRPPQVISDPKESGNLEARWMVTCDGCLKQTRDGKGVASPLAVKYKRHMTIILEPSAGGLVLSDKPMVLS